MMNVITSNLTTWLQSKHINPTPITEYFQDVMNMIPFNPDFPAGSGFCTPVPASGNT
jgi:hypothetical protein